MTSVRSEQARKAFDSIADTFDATFENDTTRRLRRALYSGIMRLVPSGSRVLDISCGSGIDAIALHEMGYRVSVADVSAEMVRVCSSKFRAHGVTCPAYVCSMEDAGRTITDRFDLILSNFGAINCLPDLERLPVSIASLLRPGGTFLAVIMPRISPWEIISGLLRFRPGFAFRRFQRDTPATGFGPNHFPVTYFSERAIRMSFSPLFETMGIEGWNVFSPPPHAQTFVQRFPSLTGMLEALDDHLSTLPVFRTMGDHIVVTCTLK